MKYFRALRAYLGLQSDLVWVECFSGDSSRNRMWFFCNISRYIVLKVWLSRSAFIWCLRK